MTTASRHRRRYPQLTDAQYREMFRAEVLPPQPWTYTLTPRLVQNLVRVADAAGQLRAAPLSYYRQKELAAEAKRMRVAWNAARSEGVGLDEVDVVLRGGHLPERRQHVAELIRRAARVEDALEHFTALGRNRRLTAAIAMTYRTCTADTVPGIALPKSGRFGRPDWSLYGPRERARLLDAARDAVTVPPKVAELFAWTDADELVSKLPVLRAAMLFWGLTLLDPSWRAVSVVIHHELRVGDVDPHGVMMLTEATVAQHELLSTPSHRMACADQGDLTGYFEEFTWSLSLVLRERLEQLGRVHSNERYLPWKVAAPTDELDGKLVDTVDRLRGAGSAAIVEALGADAPRSAPCSDGSRSW